MDVRSGAITRVRGWVRPWVHWLLLPVYYRQAIGRLTRLEQQCQKQSGELFDVPFRFQGPGAYDVISPSQVVSEIRPLYDIVHSLHPRYVCEIGTDKGGTFYLWCKAAAEDATVISVDLPSRGRYSPERRRLYARFQKTDLQRLHFVAGDSHTEETRARVTRMLGGNLLDFLFIDGDHSYEGVRRDYEMYSPLVRTGGVIAFHDIRTERAEVGVPRYWAELKQVALSAREFITPGAGGPYGAGIGLIEKNPDGAPALRL